MTASAQILASAMGRLAGKVPFYTITGTAVTRTGHAGTIRVDDPAQLQAAMDDWQRIWTGYEPRIYADDTDPCLAVWSRWNTCE